MADNTKPYKGIDSLLNKLATLRYKTAVLSNKPHDMALLTIDKFLGRWKFDVVFGQRPGIPIKPDPAGALEIAELFQIPPKEFLYLGDTGTDMITAKAAGMHAVGVLWGFRKADELLENGADTLISTPTELFKFIDV